MKRVTLPEQREVEGKVFPLVFQPDAFQSTEELCKYITANRDEMLELAKDHGALLFRGFDSPKAQDFADVVKSLELENMPYVGGAAVRTNVVGDFVFTANESPPSEPIPFHHEMAQVPNPPKYVMFFCETAPSSGGHTPLLMSNEVYQYFSTEFPEVCRKCEELGVRYIRVMPSEDDPSSAIGRSWKSTFQTTSKEGAEAAMRNIGTEWEWLPNGDLKTITAIVPAIRCDGRTGKRMFFNSIVAAYTGWVDSRNDPVKSVVYGDGTPMDATALEGVAKKMQQLAVSFPWQAGDVLIADNTVVMHSRTPFSPPRRVLASVARGPVRKQNPGITLRSGDKIPHVGFGFWKVPRDVTASVVVDAIKSGYRHLDCACDYGNEAEVGQGISQAIAEGLCSREDLFVTSKLWNTYHAKEHVEMAARKSLTDLGIKYFDLYLIHFPIALKFVPFDTRYPPEWFFDPTAPNPRMEFAKVPVAETWRAMEGLVTSGLARNIGVSNFNTQALRDLLSYCKIPPAVLQVELHPYNTQEKLLRFCEEAGIAVTGFSPLGHASYIELNMAKEQESAMTEPVVVAAAKAHNRTPAQVILRWGVQRGTCVIPKTTKAARMVENLSVQDFTLSPEEMAAINALNRDRRFNDPGVFCEGGMNTFCPIYE